VEKSVRLNTKERSRVIQALRELGIATAPSQTNFVLFDVGRPARPVYEALLRRGVIVRPFGNLPTSLRVTFGMPEENDRFLTSLREVLS
jgi:histidinol-phosphate aminotransferase